MVIARKGTFFCESKLGLDKIVIVTHERSKFSRVKKCFNRCVMLTYTFYWIIIKIKKRFMTQTGEERRKIGGDGMIVEIDETVIVRRKTNVCRATKTQ